MTLLTTRRSQNHRSLLKIPHHGRCLRSSFSPTPLQARWTALRQKSIGNTTACRQYDTILIDPISKYLLEHHRGAAAVTNGTPHPPSARGKHAARTTNTSCTTMAGPSKTPGAQKRQRYPDDGDDEDPKRNRKSQSMSRVDIPQIKLHMCPYQLRPSPIGISPRTPEVCTKGIKPGRVREHIRRHHLQPAQCLNCGRRGDWGQIKEHSERRKCNRRSGIIKVPQEIRDIDKQLTLQSKTTWEEVWALLFGPDAPLPQEADRYIRICSPQGGKKVVDAIVDWEGATLAKAFLRSEEFQRISKDYPWIEPVDDEEDVADPQMESLLSIIEENRKRKDLQTESNTPATEKLGFVLAPSNADIDLNQGVTTHEELPQGFTSDEYLDDTWVEDLGGEAPWDYGIPNDPAVGTGPTEDGVPNEDQASAWVASFGGGF